MIDHFREGINKKKLFFFFQKSSEILRPPRPPPAIWKPQFFLIRKYSHKIPMDWVRPPLLTKICKNTHLISTAKRCS